MKRLIPIALVVGLLAPAGHALGQDIAGRNAPLRHMDRAERHLLAALDAIRQAPSGPQRDMAMDEARQALIRTQEARARAIGALGLGDPVRSQSRSAARAAFQAMSQAQDIAAGGDRARIGYAIDRAEHALSMARLEPLERGVVDSWLREAHGALDRGDRRAVRRSLEQAEWALRGSVETPPGWRLEAGG
ncbi:hypothetical protein [Falsiroseomonas sp. E2-1-a20]|uniref:hypothetical protein n=1 Tax=Falsiroseomonas sp. E2-1-a20 TaxID=3239300 RepID=UPI003F3C4A51